MAGMASRKPSRRSRRSPAQLFEATGAVGYLMVLCSMTGTALVIEHAVNLRREKLAPAPLIQDLQALIDEEQYDEAIELCDQEGGYISNLVARPAHAPRRLRGDDPGPRGRGERGVVQAAGEDHYLSLIGNVGPLLGLLGTVTGMISSFQVIEH
jgi:biopolymer transport protein ExbB